MILHSHINQQQLLQWSQNTETFLSSQNMFLCMYPALQSLTAIQAFHEEMKLLFIKTKQQREATQLSFDETVFSFDETRLSFDETRLSFDETVFGFWKRILRKMETKSSCTHCQFGFGETGFGFLKTIHHFGVSQLCFAKTVFGFKQTAFDFLKTGLQCDQQLFSGLAPPV